MSIMIPRRLARLALAPLMLALSACASNGQPGAGLYLLDQDAPAPVETSRTPVQSPLVVAQVELAPYLTGGGIVYQTGPNRIVSARNNRWAAPLAGQLTDGLYTSLSRLLPDAVVHRPGGRSAQPAYRLVTRIDRFQGHYEGTAQVEGTWALLAPDGALIAQRRFERSLPLQTDGYPALVRALSRGWREIRQAVAATVVAAIAERAAASRRESS